MLRLKKPEQPARAMLISRLPLIRSASTYRRRNRYRNVYLSFDRRRLDTECPKADLLKGQRKVCTMKIDCEAGLLFSIDIYINHN